MKRILVGSSLLAGLLVGPLPAQASGFLAARFGGEHGHPTTSNPTAIYYNPAGLALEPYGPVGEETDLGWGFRLYIDGTLAYRHASYDRPAAAISRPGTGTPDDAISANAGEAELNNLIASPFISLTSNFGIENFGAGLAFYVPFGGVAEWGQNEAFEGNTTYPGAVDGVQRWWTMDGRIQSAYLTAGAAYRFPALRLSVGGTLSAVQSRVNTIRARNSDGSDDLVSGGRLQEGRSWIDVDGWNLGAGLGVIWEPIDQLWIGASYQSKPGFGSMTLDGELHTTLGTSAPDVTKVELKQSMPDIWRFGARWRPKHDWELRLFGEYVNWSAFTQQCILIREDAAGNEVKDRKCSFLANGALAPDGKSVTQNIIRNWKDAFGIRGGVSYWFNPAIEGYVGAGYDSNAVPDETMDPALMDMPKYTAAVGGQFQLTSRWLLAATLTQVFYQNRTVDVGDVTRFEPPSAQPNSAGTYKQSITVLNAYTQYTF